MIAFIGTIFVEGQPGPVYADFIVILFGILA